MAREFRLLAMDMDSTLISIGHRRDRGLAGKGEVARSPRRCVARSMAESLRRAWARSGTEESLKRVYANVRFNRAETDRGGARS